MDEVMDGLPADPRPLVSVVVPAYNEALKLMGSLTAIYAYLGTLQDRYRFELIVVDDGSTDETGDIADVFAKTHTGVIVLHHKVNFRLGQALQYAIGQSKGAYVVTFDSDLSYSVDHIGRMLDALSEQHARVVVASPYMKGGETERHPVAAGGHEQGRQQAAVTGRRTPTSPPSPAWCGPTTGRSSAASTSRPWARRSTPRSSTRRRSCGRASWRSRPTWTGASRPSG